MSNRTLSRTEQTTWSHVGARILPQIARWSGRDDVLAYVEPGKGGATALYNHETKNIEINPEVCFAGLSPEMIGGLDDYRSRMMAPVGTGAVYHEAMHARHSVPSMEHFMMLEKGQKQDPNLDLIIQLEEGRIETRGARFNTGFKVYLRASTLEVAFREAESPKVDDDGNPLPLMVDDQTLALIAARSAAGILKPTDLSLIRAALIEELGQEKHDRLWDLAVEFGGLGDNDFYNMSRIAAEWREIEPKPIQIMIAMGGGDGDDGDQDDQDGDSRSGAEKMMDDILKSMGDNAKDITAQAGRERDAEASAEKTKAMKDKERKRKTFQKISSHTVRNTPTNSTLVEERKPKNTEKRAMLAMARELDKARYRDRRVITSKNQVPPGRLRMRSAMANSVSKQQGRPMTAEPFKANRRKHTDETTVTVGTIVDISGSMSGAMEDMASMSWIISNAVHQVEGDAATIYFGQSTFPTLFPGERQEMVKVYSARDGHEEFREASTAIDGALDLTYGHNARIAMVVSDGQYKHDEEPAIEPWIREMNAAGVAVVWMGYGWPNDTLVELAAKMPMFQYLPMQEMVDKGTGNALEVAAGIVGKTACDLLRQWQG